MFTGGTIHICESQCQKPFVESRFERPKPTSSPGDAVGPAWCFLWMAGDGEDRGSLSQLRSSFDLALVTYLESP